MGNRNLTYKWWKGIKWQTKLLLNMFAKCQYLDEITGGKAYTDKKEAGTAIIAMCKEIKGINASADVGEYLGFKLNVTFDSFNNKFVMNVKGAMSYPMEVGTDPLGNITRINNALEAMPAQLEEAQTKLSNVEHQLETAKAEVNKPFAQEAELSEKLDRLTALDALLNMDEKGNDAIEMDDETEPERKLADRPAERISLKGKLSEMKARVSGTPAGRDAVDKAKGKEVFIWQLLVSRRILSYPVRSR